MLSLKGPQGSSVTLSVLCSVGTDGDFQCVHIGGLRSQSWSFPFFICNANVVLIADNKIEQEKTPALLMFIFIPFNLWPETSWRAFSDTSTCRQLIKGFSKPQGLVRASCDLNHRAPKVFFTYTRVAFKFMNIRPAG